MSDEAREGRQVARTAARPQGATIEPDGGVSYRIWAPDTKELAVAILEDVDEDEVLRVVPLKRNREGYFSGVDEEGEAGDLYKFQLQDELIPDPFSLWQPGDPISASMVIDSSAYEWRVNEWRRVPLLESVIYELHVGAFTTEGTFRSAIEKLDYLVDLGVTTIELMPLAAFSGSRNWGYDGVMLFAPDSSYGHPDDLRALIDAAHRRGLNVLLDVVYNHFGPDGNYLSRFSGDYFDDSQRTPWGSAINFGGRNNQHVRQVFLANVAYWMDDFRIDGFRLDATHAILDRSTPHILTEIARTVHDREGIVIAEDERNLATLALPPRRRGTGLDGLWADDFHHVIRVALTGNRDAYFGNFTGTPEELAETLNHGWLYTGQVAPVQKAPRGTPAAKLRLEQFVHCISNHDQVGNRALGERLHHIVDPGAYRAASLLLCLSPCVPMLFMGQEWAASSPFLYFTDHLDELGEKVSEGRRREFSDFFSEAASSGAAAEVPDPQAETTFFRSKLNWVERSEKNCSGMLALYAEALALRAHPAIARRDRKSTGAAVVGEGVVALRYTESAHSGLLLLLRLGDATGLDFARETFLRLPRGWGWSPVLSSNEERFGGNGASLSEGVQDRIDFTGPEAVVFQPVERI